MTVRAMSATQIGRFTKSMETQGVGVTRTKKGLLLRLPDGETTMLHFTTSDVRATQNLKSRLRRAGVTHPDDKKMAEMPQYVTSGTVRKKNKELLWQWIRDNGYPSEVNGPDLAQNGLHFDPSQMNRVLYHSGFVPLEKLGRKGRPWQTPEWLLEESVVREAEVEHEAEIESEIAPLMEFAERAHNAQIAINDMGYGEPDVSRETEREFLDSMDSWVVDLSHLPMNVSLGEYLQSMRASGLQLEIRVWRA